jgi:hypothetical protein
MAIISNVACHASIRRAAPLQISKNSAELCKMQKAVLQAMKINHPECAERWSDDGKKSKGFIARMLKKVSSKKK